MSVTSNRVRFPVFSQEAYHYTRGADLNFLSFEREEGGVHNYVEPMYGTETDLIEMTIEDSRLTGYVEAPAGSSLARCGYDNDLGLFVPGDADAYTIYEAVDIAKDRQCGLRWIKAKGE